MPTPPPSSLPSGPPGPARQRIVVAAVCLRDHAGRVLTVRKRGTARFLLPGGKLEPGETPAEAAAREVHEEVGLEVSGLRLLGRFTAAAANEPGALVESTVFTAALPGQPSPAGEIEELHWLHPDAASRRADRLAPLLRDHVLPALAAAGPPGPTRPTAPM